MSNPSQVNGITLEQRQTLLTMPQGAYLPRLSSEVTAGQRVQNSFGCPKKIGPMCLFAIGEEIKQKSLEVAVTFATTTCPPDYDVVEVFK